MPDSYNFYLFGINYKGFTETWQVSFLQKPDEIRKIEVKTREKAVYIFSNPFYTW